MSDAQIEAGMFRTVKPFQCVNASPRLFGVDFRGRRVIVASRAIVCPVWDVQGRIIGWQYRLDNASDGGKYRWASSKDKPAHIGDELPLSLIHI